MRRALLAVVGVAVSVVALAAGTGTAAAALPSWRVAATLSLGTEGVAVDCGTASSCWSLESGRLLSSANGGQSWTDRTDLVPDGIASLDDLDCVTAQHCYVAATDDAGNGVLLFLDHGVVVQHPVPGAPTLSTISCTPPDTLRAGDRHDSYNTDDGGSTWSQGTLGRTLLGKTAVNCVAGTTTCYLVGNYGLVPTILKSTNRGRSWTLQTAPYNDGGIYDIACPTVTDCYATGADYSDDAIVIRTVDGGAHWNFANVPFHAYPLRSVSCPTATDCTAFGHSPGNTPFVFATTDGQHWNPQTIDPVTTAEPPQVSCPSTTSCTAVASAVAFVTTDSGTTWQTVDVPAGLEAPSELACANGARCVGFGSDAAGKPFVITTPDFGTTWTRGTLPADVGHLGGLDCPTRLTCFATAVVPVTGTPRSQTQFLTSSDGGATWAVTATRKGGFGALSCPSDTTCVSTGYDPRGHLLVAATTDSAAHWHAVPAPDTTTLAGFACGTVTSCVFVMGTFGGSWTSYTTDDLGATYQPHAMPAADWFGMDCAGQFCMVAGSRGGDGAIATSPDGGATWDDRTVPRQAQLIDAVSCGSPTSCAASTYDFTSDTGGPRIVGTIDGGATWRVHAVPARHEAPLAVACFNTRCIASDYSTAANPIIVAGGA